MKNENCLVDGITKPLLQWCEMFNQKPEVVRSRMSLGIGLDEALRTFSNQTDLLFDIDGEIHTLQHWSRIYCINFKTILSRLKMGWEHVAAITMPVTKTSINKKRYTVGDKEYALEELSLIFKINQSTIKNRLKNGETICEALDLLPSKRKKLYKDNALSAYHLYSFDGKTMTMLEWCSLYDMDIHTVIYRIQCGYNFESAIKTSHYIRANKYDVDGRLMTLSEIEEEFHIPARLFYKRVFELGYSVKDAIEVKNDPVTYNINDEMLTISQISERTGIKKITLYARLKKGWSIEKCINTPVVERGTLYTLDGEQLTLIEISKKYGISYSRLFAKVVSENIPIEEAVIMKECRRFLVDGEYLSIEQLAEKYQINPQTILHRLSVGDTIEQAIRPIYK